MRRISVTKVQRRAFVSMSVSGLILAILNCGDNNGPDKSNGVTKITVNEAATGLDSPVDATPDPMGVTIYFIAKTSTGPGIFSVPLAGGTPTTLYSGAPLVNPRGIS